MTKAEQYVVGIDLCDDITQVTVMRPYFAEPEAVVFDAQTLKEFLPTTLVKSGDHWELERHGEYAGKRLAGFFHAAVLGKTVFLGEQEFTGFFLVKTYLGLLLERIKSRFPDQTAGFAALTCEEAKDAKAAELLRRVFLELGFLPEQFLLQDHLNAFLHYAVRQEEGLWKKGASAFDYTTDGLRYYSMECLTRGGERLLLSDSTDYSDVMPPDYLTTETPERAALTFERLAGKVLQEKPTTLYITGRGFEGDWTSDVLRTLSIGRRVFRGQNLYTQGACYKAADIFFEKQSAPFAILLPNQITYDVYLQAEDGEEKECCMARTGEEYTSVHSVARVLLDTVDKLTFRIVKAGMEKEYIIRMAPHELQVRPDRTSCYEVRVFFAKKTMLVIQMKELGFGELYPSGNRLYEEIIDLTQLEQ